MPDARPAGLEAQRPAALEVQGKPQVTTLEGPGRSTGFAAQSQSQSQGPQRMGKDDIAREVSCFFFDVWWGKCDVNGLCLDPSALYGTVQVCDSLWCVSSSIIP